MRRSWKMTLVAAVTAVSLVATTTPAQAAPVSPGSTGYAAPAQTGTAQLSVSLSLTGVLGGLLDWLITPIVQSAINPLVGALQGTVNTLVSATLGSSSMFTAGTPSAQSSPGPSGSFPNDMPGSLPSPCSSSGAQPCFNAVNLGVDLSPLAKIVVGAVSGYTQQVDSTADAKNPMFGRSHVANTSIGVLTFVPSPLNPLLSLGAVDAKSSCPNDGSTAPSAQVSTAGVDLLGGLIQLDVLNGKLATVTIAGTSYSLSSLGVISVPVAGLLGVKVSPYGTALKVAITVGLSELLNGLGLAGSVITQLLGYALPNTSVTLTLIVGPGSSVTSTSASSWGLGAGVDLSGTLSFDLLGLVGANISIPTGIGGGNLGNVVDLRLAYTTCTASSAASGGGPVPAIPPALR